MSYLDILIRKVIQVGGVSKPERGKINFVNAFTAADNPVTGATDLTCTASGTFTPPTGTGLVTVTSGALDAASTVLGTGISTFLTTPSGANLATALTTALPDSKGGTGLTSLGSGVATFLGTPSGANLASALTTALPDTKGGTGLTALGTGVATFLGTPSGANLASALTTALPDSKGGTGLTALAAGIATFLGTPSGANLASALTTALPDTKGGTGLTSLASGVATFLGTPSSANLLSALTTKTGTGNAVFGTSPTIASPAISTPTVTGDTLWGLTSHGIIGQITSAGGSVSTTDATPLAILSYAMAASTVADLIITVVARRTGGSAGTAGDAYRADFPVCYQRIASAGPTLVGAAAAETGKKSNGGGSAYAVGISVVSNNIVVTVTGVTDVNITWIVSAQGQQVS